MEALATSSHIYLANSSGNNIYVFVSPSTGWAVADFVGDVALMFVGIGEIKIATTVANFPRYINTMADVYNFFKAFALLASGTGVVTTRSFDAAKQVAQQIKEKMDKIAIGGYQDVSDKGFLGLYLSPSGYAAMLAGAETMTLTVVSEDMKQVAQFTTNPDHSWIATDTQKIVRSKYGGSVFEQDPAAGTIDWHVGGS